MIICSGSKPKSVKKIKTFAFVFNKISLSTIEKKQSISKY